MSKESVIQSMKEDLDYRNAFGKYISSCEGQYCEEAQYGYAAENNIELED
jgi:hypothetical protein